MSAATFTVPGTSNPYLAGLPSGATASGDSAPAQSPVQVTGVPITAGTILNFLATGSVNFISSPSGDTPDGGSLLVSRGAENGIAGYNDPANSLVGVFLDNSLPTDSAAPAALNFDTPASRAYSTLSPLLKQIFFIGDGLTGTGTGTQQSVVVPFGATRLFLGTVDGSGWSNNFGQFTVEVNAAASTSVPEPFTIVGTLVGSAAAFRMRKKVKATTNKL
ncbi:MAG: PEP-CTERM sorting domain-containing protein [Chamaesiphon sp. CSU_1_12]|nr:PEP-CTERM sorting domain-containing protein [Chamaesiphon sp. CSU_1_12]